MNQTPTPLHPVATTQAGELPTLPKSLLDLIGEYGMARTDGLTELDRIALWQDLILGIKDYALASQAADVVPVDGVRWDLFPGYLIDHCEGDTITEEGLQFAVARMLKSADYLAAAAHPSPTTAPASEPADEQVAEICASIRMEDFVTGEMDTDYFRYDGAIVRAYLAAQVAASKPAENKQVLENLEQLGKPAAASGEPVYQVRLNGVWYDVTLKAQKHYDESKRRVLFTAPALPATGEAELTKSQIEALSQIVCDPATKQAIIAALKGPKP